MNLRRDVQLVSGRVFSGVGISVEHRELRERTSEGFLLAGRQQLYLVYDDQPGIMAFCTVGSHNRGRYAFVDGGVNNPQTQIPDRREPV